MVYEDNDHVVLMDSFPINRGHVLVVPKKHYETLYEMPSEEVGSLFRLVQRIMIAVRDATGADGMNIGQNNGTSAHQIIPHVHVHVIPRYEGDAPAGGWPVRERVTTERLEEVAKAIRDTLHVQDQ